MTENEMAICFKNVAKQKIHIKPKRVIVAFADVVGFAHLIEKAHALLDFRYLVMQLYKKLAFMRKELGYHLKFLGDGGMLVRELKKGHNCLMTVQFLKEMDCLNKYMSQVISEMDWPRPAGFRIRIAAGNVSKLYVKMCTHECSLQKDYVGYPVNLASRLLDISKEINPLVCHESVKDIIGAVRAKENDLHFTRVLPPSHIPKGIDPEDTSHLWEFYFGKRN